MVERVIAVMRERLCDPLSLADMADIACVSPFYFSHLFRAVVGIPPGEFLAALRLDAAKRLLLTTNLSVTDVCFEVGYSGLGSFTTRFTQMIGCSPRQLRQRASCVMPLADGIRGWSPVPSLLSGLTGQIDLAGPFHGCILIGLFPKPIPQGGPVCCTRLSAPGPFQLGPIPEGCWYLLSVALPYATDPSTYLLPDPSAPVCIYGPLYIERGVVPEPVTLHLRPRNITDPPIITAVPML